MKKSSRVHFFKQEKASAMWVGGNISGSKEVMKFNLKSCPAGRQFLAAGLKADGG